MSDEAWCYLALATGLAVLCVITLAVLSAPRSGLFKGFGDVRAQWRSCASDGERLLLLWSLTLQMIRGGMFAFLAAVIGAVISMSLSLCGTSPQTVDKVLAFLRDLLNIPSRPAAK